MSLLTKYISSASAQAYYEMEGSCNTCKRMERVAHSKSTHGTIYGRCRVALSSEVMRFHPRHPMQIGCYELRQPRHCPPIDAVKLTA